MKSIFYTFLLLFCFCFSHAQFDCMHIPIDDPALTNNAETNNLSATGGLVKLYFHVYNDANGNGGFPVEDIPLIMDRLHMDFAQTNFTFYYNECETEIVNSDFYHDSGSECDFFPRGNVRCNDGVDIHLKGDNANFRLVSDGIPGSQILIGGMGYGVQFATSSVISHEMGHVFGLLHTFHGYCYQTGVDCAGNDIDIPCNTDGDGVSDTPLDRNLLVTAVNEETCEWNGFSTCLCDETIVTSPTDNFMAYTRPTCMSNFTNGQKSRMYAKVNSNFIHSEPIFCDPVPSYGIYNGDGVLTSEFCVGDKVVLKACASKFETKYRIGIFEYEIGGYANGDDNTGYSRTDPSWIQTQAPCDISLNDIWANFEDYEFRAGFEYRVQLAVQNDCSSGWFVKDDGIFTFHHPTPDYVYVDENGTPKNEFCVEEIVYLNGSASFDENKYFIGLWKYNLGGFANGEGHLAYSRTDPKWQFGEVGEQINLNEIWGNFQDFVFEPGFEYRVQLVVRGECDPGGWNVKEDEVFTVVCCEDVDGCADFEVTTVEDSDGNILFTFTNKDNFSYSHQWTVYQHEKQDEGPYEVVAESNDPDFEFTGAIGGCYTIVHHVDTPCGSCCYSREVCNDAEKGGFQQLSSTVGCDINCDDIVPTGLSCTVLENGLMRFDWDDVEGVDFYLFRFLPFDPECCDDNIPSNEAGRVTDISEYEFEDLATAHICFSWRVEVYCEGGGGQLSPKKCYSPEEGCGDMPEDDDPKDDDPKDDDPKDPKFKAINGASALGSSSISVYPNPTKGEINLDLHLGDDENVENISVIGLDGRVIDNILFKQQEERAVGKYSFQSDLSGIFFIRVQLNDKVLMKKIMLIK